MAKRVELHSKVKTLIYQVCLAEIRGGEPLGVAWEPIVLGVRRFAEDGGSRQRKSLISRSS